jgi:Mrp family chromosome partitioning ATPase
MTWSWPWHRRRDLEKRVEALEQTNLRVLGILENISQIVGIPRESMELQTAIRELRGQLPADRGDQPYHW